MSEPHHATTDPALVITDGARIVLAMAPRGQNRAKLVESMRDLVLHQGYGATGVDEVAAAADVSKGAFYHHFGSKEDLVLAAVEMYFDDVVTGLTSADDVEYDDPVDALRAFLVRAIDVCTGPLVTGGCLLGLLSLELGESHPTVRADVGRRFGALADELATLLDAAADSRGVELPTAALARQFLAVLEGAIVLSKAHADTDVIREALELYTNHVELLLAAS